ncbi:DUF7344 domain-containing protein [Natronococcus jeotgali]|uniref:DUF7344 domain-containing protein n=1 Tax=Natronococcus jeotgali DSM 18795 TaxID=1227498 RepID=L9WU84_9EURY|nr:hypothetical protein [Natronococcus jeotgali]ELY53005.1 hypothetical protein C492_18129 [Natronococcus jeotgali DSM 18795]
MSLQTDHPPRPANDAETEAASLSDDDVFHILQTNRRRDAIRYLLEQDEPVRMRDVAEYVAATENDTSVAKLTSTERQRVYIPLYQSHLPKLDSEGIIEYNKSRGIVRPTEKLELFRPYLELSGVGEADGGAAERPDAIRAAASASLLLASAIGAYAAVAAAATSLPLAIALGAVAFPGFVLGTVATARLALGLDSAGVPSLLRSGE